MSKKILLIDSDESFAQGLSRACNSKGFEALLATDSEEGMTLAKEGRPDLIVVCVEAQPTNGYMLCTRLKKDDKLKQIPIILTSANATPDAFEKHKKLKTRAEEYLIKPFEPRVMLEKASELLGLPLGGQDVNDREEIVSMEDEQLGLHELIGEEDEPISLSEEDAAEARAAPREEAVILDDLEEEIVSVDEAGDGGDADLDKFDEAFDALASESEKLNAKVGHSRAPQAAKAAQPEEEDEPPAAPTELSAPDDDQVLDGLLGDSELEQRRPTRAAEPPMARAARADKGGVLKLKDARDKADEEIDGLQEELTGKEQELAVLQEQKAALETQVEELAQAARKRESASKALQQRADALAAAAKKFERELTQAREQLKSGGAKRGELDELRKELDNARAEMSALTGEKELLGEEREELRQKLEEAQAAAAQNEERAVKAYQKIKQDEKLREKTRKALQVALQLLDEHAVEHAIEEPGEAEMKSA